MQTFWQDIRFGVRMLLKNPGFAIVAVLTLSLGIGANTAIFSVVSAVLLRDLPFPDSDRIVTLWENNLLDGLERDDVSPGNFMDWRERQTSFQELAFANPYGLYYVPDGEPLVFRSALVSKGFFEVLQANPRLGRVFAPEEYEEGKNKVVVLGYGLWQRRFGEDPNIVGRTLLLNHAPVQVVGVMPAAFKFPRAEIDLWMPLAFDAKRTAPYYFQVIGRLKPGLPPSQAQAETTEILQNFGREHPNLGEAVGLNEGNGPRTVVRPLKEFLS